MRISDWSSDVCSSDLRESALPDHLIDHRLAQPDAPAHLGQLDEALWLFERVSHCEPTAWPNQPAPLQTKDRFQETLRALPGSARPTARRCPRPAQRSEERRVGEGCVRTRRARWSQFP